MKKSLVMLMLLSLLLCACGKEEAVPETAPMDTAAPTEYVEEITTDPEAIMDPEDITEPAETETVIRLVRTSVLNERGEEMLYREYSYDEYGRQTEIWEYSDGEVAVFSATAWLSDTQCETVSHYGENTTTVRSTYDEAGNLLRLEYLHNGRTTDYTYDEFGNTLTVQNNDGSSFRYAYTYDDGGRILVQEEYLGDDLVGRLETEYDEAGRETASVYHYPDGSVNYRTVTAYDGATETRTSFDSEGIAYLTQITVTDEQGNVLSRETWQGNEMVSRTENTYQKIEIIAQ